MAALFGCFGRPLTDDRSRSDSSTRSRDTRDGPLQNGAVAPDSREVAYVELLRRSTEPLGLVIEGGADRGVPAQVAVLRPGGVAAMSGALQVGDHILSINGTPTEHLVHTEVNALLQNAGNVVNLEISFETPPGPEVDDGTVKKVATLSIARERNSFGFTISGGRTENRPIRVSNVAVGTSIFRSGTLKVGDRLLTINGVDVTRATQVEALSLLKSSEDTCTFQIEYDVTVHEGLADTHGALQVELLKPKGVSLGISLRGSRTQGEPIWISAIKEAGNADRCGALHVGDQLLSVNDVSVENKSINDVFKMLVQSDLHVRLEIVLAHNFPDHPDFSSEEAFSDSMSHISNLPPFTAHGRQSQLSVSSAATTANMLTHPETMNVQLKADSIGFGLSLGGGASEYDSYPLVIATIVDGGPAARLGQLQEGDRIVAINGVRTEGVTLHQAVKLIQEAGDVIDVEVEFDITDTVVPTSGTFEVKLVKTLSLNLGIAINGSHRPGDPIWISNLKKGGVAYRMGLLRPGDVLLAINDQSLEQATLRDGADLLQRAGDVVTLKVSKEGSAHLVGSSHQEPVVYTVELHRHGQSLGITLSGSSTHAGQPIVISHIREGGFAHQTGTMKLGDRILAINGESLYSKTVPEAVRILQEARDPVSLKISKASRRSRGRPRHSSLSGRAYRGSNRDLMPPSLFHRSYSRRATPTSSLTHRLLPRINSYSGSSHFLPGLQAHRLSATTLATTTTSGRSTPEPHRSTISLDRQGSVLSVRSGSIRSHRNPSVLLERTSLGSNGQPESAFTQPGAFASRLPGAHALEYGVGGVPPGRRLSQGSFTETDGEISQSEHEGLRVKGRRDSAPVHSPYGGVGRWAKPRRASQGSPRIPVGRVTPLVPPSTEPASSPAPQKLGPVSRRVSGATSPIPMPLTEMEEASDNGAKADSGPRLTTKVPPPPVPAMVPSFSPSSTAPKSVTDAQTGETCLHECEKTLVSSGKYIEEMNQIANSGSSDQDSDSEPRALQREAQPHQHALPTQLIPRTIQLWKERGSDLGFSVSDGQSDPGVYVRALRPGGPANQDGELHPYDRILKVNDREVKDMDCCHIVPLLNEIEGKVTLIVARNPLAGSV